MRSKSGSGGASSSAQLAKQGLQVQCKLDESAFINVFDNTDCKGLAKEGRSMDKESFDNFRKGECGNFERGPGGGGGGMGKGPKGSMKFSGDIDESAGAEDFGSCKSSFKARMSVFEDNACGRPINASKSEIKNRTFGKERFGIMKQGGGDGDFRQNRCQKVQSEDPSETTSRPRQRGMKMVCNSDQSMKLQIFDDESCGGRPAEERKMPKESAKKFKRGECADFQKPDQENDKGYMKREIGDGGSVEIPDCANMSENKSTNNMADSAIHNSFLGLSATFPLTFLVMLA